MDSFAVGGGRVRGESMGGESMGAITADICRVGALVPKPTILQIQRDADIDIVPVNVIQAEPRRFSEILVKGELVLSSPLAKGTRIFSVVVFKRIALHRPHLPQFCALRVLVWCPQREP